ALSARGLRAALRPDLLAERRHHQAGDVDAASWAWTAVDRARDAPGLADHHPRPDLPVHLAYRLAPRRQLRPGRGRAGPDTDPVHLHFRMRHRADPVHRAALVHL